MDSNIRTPFVVLCGHQCDCHGLGLLPFRYTRGAVLPDPAGGGCRSGASHQVPVSQTQDSARGRHDQGSGGLRLCRDKKGVLIITNWHHWNYDGSIFPVFLIDVAVIWGCFDPSRRMTLKSEQEINIFCGWKDHVCHKGIGHTSIQYTNIRNYGQVQYPNCRSCNFVIRVKCVNVNL